MSSLFGQTNTNVIADVSNQLQTVKQNEDPYIIGIYAAGMVVYIFIFYFLVYRYFKKWTVFVVGILTLLVLYANLYYSTFNALQSYSDELNVYSYVETNARTIATISLAIVLLSQLYKERDEKKTEVFINLIITAFVFSILILLIIWAPINDPFFIRILRDIKTVFLTYSISFLVLGMLYFVQIRVV